MKQQTATTLAYTAGFLDGEGCITITSQRRSQRKGRELYLSVVIGQSNERIVQWFRMQYGGSVHLRHRCIDEKHKPHWVWLASRRTAVAFLKLIRPYLKLKQAQADIGIKFGEGKRIGARFYTQEEIDKLIEYKDQIQALNDWRGSRRATIPNNQLKAEMTEYAT